MPKIYDLEIGYDCNKVRPYVSVIDFLDTAMIRKRYQSELNKYLAWCSQSSYAPLKLKEEEKIYKIAIKHDFTVEPIILGRKTRSKKRLRDHIDKLDDLERLEQLEQFIKKKVYP